MLGRVGIAEELADWAAGQTPDAADLDLARRGLLDTLGVALAARGHPLLGRLAPLPEAARWAVAAHVLDFDDLHLPSTAHVSAVCVPATLACGGDARTYLVGAGVMARLGAALGWPHYTRGWHATCTAGAPAAAAAVATTLGLDAEGIARALALAVPAAGGVQRAFGTDAKSLQVGFAVEAGVRAARLAAAGAGADPAALDQWLDLVGAAAPTVGKPGPATRATPAVPGGLAVKVFPCCYALQRPIAALRELLHGAGPDPDAVTRVRVRTPRGTTQPLIHHRPTTGLAGKFSLEYAMAATVLDGYPGLASFTDEAVRRPRAQRLLALVEVELTTGGDGLLDGAVEIELEVGGERRAGRLASPPGAPDRPPSPADLAAKLDACGPDVAELLDGVDWVDAPGRLRASLAVPPP